MPEWIVAHPGCRSGQEGRAAIPAVEYDIVGTTANQIEPGRPRVNVETGHPQGVVVVP